jgi:hypothetical protein
MRTAEILDASSNTHEEYLEALNRFNKMYSTTFERLDKVIIKETTAVQLQNIRSTMESTQWKLQFIKDGVCKLEIEDVFDTDLMDLSWLKSDHVRQELKNYYEREKIDYILNLD